jgi:hypothetical protein
MAPSQLLPMVVVRGPDGVVEPGSMVGLVVAVTGTTVVATRDSQLRDLLRESPACRSTETMVETRTSQTMVAVAVVVPRRREQTALPGKSEGMAAKDFRRQSRVLRWCTGQEVAELAPSVGESRVRMLVLVIQQRPAVTDLRTLVAVVVQRRLRTGQATVAVEL